MIFSYESYEIVIQHNMYLEIILLCIIVTEEFKVQKGFTFWPIVCCRLLILLEKGLGFQFHSPEFQIILKVF